MLKKFVDSPYKVLPPPRLVRRQRRPRHRSGPVRVKAKDVAEENDKNRLPRLRRG